MKKKFIIKLVLLTLIAFALACSALAPATPSKQDVIDTALAQLETMSTANPDGHLHEIMQQKGVTLTAKEVQYNMANNVGKEFGLAGDGEICDYYNWGYDRSIEGEYFCVEVTPGGGYSESWYIYFSRKDFSELYQVLLHENRYLMLIAKIDGNLYEKNQQNQATALYVEWTK